MIAVVTVVIQGTDVNKVVLFIGYEKTIPVMFIVDAKVEICDAAVVYSYKRTVVVLVTVVLSVRVVAVVSLVTIVVSVETSVEVSIVVTISSTPIIELDESITGFLLQKVKQKTIITRMIASKNNKITALVRKLSSFFI